MVLTSGTLPSDIQLLNNSLRALDLGFNNIQGDMPDMGNFGVLQALSLNSNGLTGTVPSDLGSMFSLKVSGAHAPVAPCACIIACVLCCLQQFINITSNAIGGTLPDSMQYLKYLQTLFMANNKITGTLPYALNDLSSLKSMYVYH